MERLSSGHPRLDEILQGGLPSNSINLIIGPPGTGKTILSQQYVFHNATQERPALYLSTVSEPFDKILRYGQGLSFFDSPARTTALTQSGSRSSAARLRRRARSSSEPGAVQALELTPWQPSIRVRRSEGVSGGACVRAGGQASGVGDGASAV